MVVLVLRRVDIATPRSVQAVVHMMASSVEAINAVKRTDVASERTRKTATALLGLISEVIQPSNVPVVEVKANA